MKRVVVNIILTLFPIAIFAQYGNPGSIKATVKGCEIELITTQKPMPQNTLWQCRIEAYWWTGGGYKSKILEYVPCNTDTVVVDLPENVPADSLWVRKRVFWQPVQGTQQQVTNSVRLPVACVFQFDTLMPPVDTIPAQPNTSWQDGNTVDWMGSNLEITAATQGTAVIMTPEGLLLQVVNFQPGQMSLPVNHSGLVFVTVYFWHEGALQVENLKIFLP